jgi:hypothetical protein
LVFVGMADSMIPKPALSSGFRPQGGDSRLLGSTQLNPEDFRIRRITGVIRILGLLLENAIRPFCVGRRAWLFHDSPEGAKAGAALHGLIQTAKAAGLEPYHYLRFVFTKLLTMKPDDQFAALLPHRLRPQDIVLPPLQLPTPDPGG